MYARCEVAASESDVLLSGVMCDVTKSSWLGKVNSASSAEKAASMLWISFSDWITSLDVAFSEERAGADAFSLPLLLPAEGVGTDAGAGGCEESESEARIAWIVSRTSDAYSFPRRDSSSAFRDGSAEVAGFGVSKVLGLVWQ